MIFFINMYPIFTVLHIGLSLLAFFCLMILTKIKVGSLKQKKLGTLFNRFMIGSLIFAVLMIPAMKTFPGENYTIDFFFRRLLLTIFAIQCLVFAQAPDTDKLLGWKKYSTYFMLFLNVIIFARIYTSMNIDLNRFLTIVGRTTQALLIYIPFFLVQFRKIKYLNHVYYYTQSVVIALVAATTAGGSTLFSEPIRLQLKHNGTIQLMIYLLWALVFYFIWRRIRKLQ